MKQNKLIFLVGLTLILLAFPIGITLQKITYTEIFKTIKLELVKHKEIKTTTPLEEELKSLVLSLDAGLLFSAKTISKLVAIFAILFCLAIGIFLILIWRIKRGVIVRH